VLQKKPKKHLYTCGVNRKNGTLHTKEKQKRESPTVLEAEKKKLRKKKTSNILTAPLKLGVDVLHS